MNGLLKYLARDNNTTLCIWQNIKEIKNVMYKENSMVLILDSNTEIGAHV